MSENWEFQDTASPENGSTSANSRPAGAPWSSFATHALTALCAFVAGAATVLASRTAVEPQPAPPTQPQRIVAYYFHRTARCPTCLAIEFSARAVVESMFSADLADGRLSWQPVDYQAPGNEYYATEYKLDAPCVVLVRFRDNHPMEWRALPEVWQCVGDRAAMTELIESNVREFLGYLDMPGDCCL